MVDLHFRHARQYAGRLRRVQAKLRNADQAIREKNATELQKILGNKIAKSLRTIYVPYLLRRTKESIFRERLSPKYDWCIWFRMNDVQIKLYEYFLNSDEVKEILTLRHDAVKSPLIQLNVLKKICHHPRLLSKDTFEKLVYTNEADLEKMTAVDVPVDLLLKESAKLTVLNQLTKVTKILLFSDSTKMLDMIEKMLKLNKTREQIVHRFQTDAREGALTLTAASRVILCKFSQFYFALHLI